MHETPQEYTHRLLSYVKGSEPVRALRAAPGRIERLMEKASKKTLLHRPQPDRWSVAEILAHLAEAELVFAYRIRMILSANGTPIQAYDQDIWQANAGYLRRKPTRGLRFFKAIRENNVVFLKSLRQADWGNYGIHSERGKESIEKLVLLMAGHDVNHLRQIRKIIKGK